MSAGLFVAEVGDVDVLLGGQFFGAHVWVHHGLFEDLCPVPHCFEIALREFCAGLEHFAAVAHEQRNDFAKSLYIVDLLDFLWVSLENEFPLIVPVTSQFNQYLIGTQYSFKSIRKLFL